jgi:uncharacterized protein (TIGR03437 family)
MYTRLMIARRVLCIGAILVAWAIPANAAAASCTPSTLVFSIANSDAGINAVVNQPYNFQLRVVDDCGNPINEGSLFLSSARGIFLASLAPLGGGIWAGTVTFTSVGTQGFQIFATSGSLNSLVLIFVQVRASSPLIYSLPVFDTPAVAGGAPVTKTMTVTSGAGQIPFTVQGFFDGVASAQFTIRPSSAVTPATLELVLQPDLESPKHDQDQLTLQLGQQLSTPISVIIAPPPPPSLVVPTTPLLFSFVGSAQPQSQTVSIGNLSGISLHFAATPFTSSGGAWLSPTPTQGDTTLRQPVSLTITADPTGLDPGTYSGLVVITADSQPDAEIPVTMTIVPDQPAIVLSQTGLAFKAVENGATEPAQTFRIVSGGQTAIQWTASVNGQPSWLNLGTTAGHSQPGLENNPDITVTADATGMPAGSYYALIEVDADDAANSPQLMTVVLNVLPNNGQPVIYIRPSGLLFTGIAGGAAPPPQTISVYDLSGGSVSFLSAASYFDQMGWLFQSPSSYPAPSVSAQPDGSVPVSVQTAPGNLTPGIHRGSITFSFPDGSTSVVSVIFQAAQAGTTPASRLSPRDDCTPTDVAIQYTAASGYTAATGWPSLVQVSAIDSCNQPFTGASLSAMFSNGDTPLSLTYAHDGIWNGTWVPQNSPPPGSQAVQLSFRAQDPARGLDATIPFPVAVPFSNSDPPVLSTSGILDLVSGSGNGVLAPGSLFAAMGERLTSMAASNDPPYQTNLSDAYLRVGAHVVPLMSVSESQITGMLPMNLAAGVTPPLQMVAARGATWSSPVPLPLAVAKPAIYADSSGQARVFHAGQPGVLADALHPAHANESLVIRCAGLGAVTPSVTAGLVSPDGTQVNTTVQVVIGGVTVNADSAGLKSGAVGIYLVQFKMPEGIAPGTVPIQLQAGGQLSEQATIAVQ